MNLSCCSCCCGNIKIKGSMVPQSIHPKVSSLETKSFRPGKSYYLIQGNSIEIQNKKEHKRCIQSSQSCNSIKCTTCNTIFKFYSNYKKTYMEKIIHFNEIEASSDQKQANLPQSNDKSQKENNSNEFDQKDIENDCDFELMFSNKYCPFVGSYTSSMFPGINGSINNMSDVDLQQISYLA